MESKPRKQSWLVAFLAIFVVLAGFLVVIRPRTESFEPNFPFANQVGRHYVMSGPKIWRVDEYISKLGFFETYHELRGMEPKFPGHRALHSTSGPRSAGISSETPNHQLDELETDGQVRLSYTRPVSGPERIYGWLSVHLHI